MRVRTLSSCQLDACTWIIFEQKSSKQQLGTLITNHSLHSDCIDDHSPARQISSQTFFFAPRTALAEFDWLLSSDSCDAAKTLIKEVAHSVVHLYDRFVKVTRGLMYGM